MTEIISANPISRLRQRMIDEYERAHFSMATQCNYNRDVRRFATFLGRPPDTATTDEVLR